MNDLIVSVTDDGQTPLNPDEAEGLKIASLSTQGDLDAAEGRNIQRAQAWAIRRARGNAAVTNDTFLRELHRRMFGQVWAWAGQYRNTERNIGVDPRQIAVQVRDLFADVEYWQQHSVYTLDECAARLHHRLTVIHPFPNGNGRASRFMADYYLIQQRAPRFSWGSSIADHDERRWRYLAAVRAGDAGDLQPLLAFVRQ